MSSVSESAAAPSGACGSRASVSTHASHQPSKLPAKKHSIANLAVRTVTIVTLGPLIVAVGLHSNFGATCLVCIGCSVGGLEWGGLKRHLKVALLLGEGTKDKARAVEPRTGEAQEVEEYPVPAPPITFLVLLRYLSWGALAWSAYYGGVKGAVMLLWLYAIIIATVTLTMHDRIAEVTAGRSHGAMNGLSSTAETAVIDPASAKSVAGRAATETPSTSLAHRGSDNTTASGAEAHASSTPTGRFRLKEEAARASNPLADRVLDVCLDVAGLVWVSAFVSVTLLYDAPYMGKPWILSTLLANFANDIFALITGRTLAAIRRAMREADETAESAAAASSTPRIAQGRGRIASLVLAGPHALSPSISPNKSVEGAVAGVLANAVGFALCMHVCYGAFFPPPPPSLVHPLFQSTLFRLLVGTLLGVLGVLGDLLESLLKRAARVKDAGFIVPGHGGVLDRFDGLLFAFPIMFCIAHAVLAATRCLAVSASA